MAKRKSRRKQRAVDPLLGWLLLLLVALVDVGAVISATHGLVLLLIPVGFGARWYRRDRLRKAAEVAAAERRQRAVEIAREEQRRAEEYALYQRQRAEEEHRQRVSLAADLGRLLALSPTEFEITVGHVIPALGYREVVHTGQTRDRGADLLAIDPEGERVVVQCKRLALTSKVGSSTVRNLIGALPLHNATTALLVTTSTFTAEAHHAANVAGIRLLDGSQLVDAARSASVLPAQQVPQPAPAAVDSSAGEGVMAEPVAPASWYADPHGGGHLRYWDGTAWTSHTHPAPPPASPT